MKWGIIVLVLLLIASQVQAKQVDTSVCSSITNEQDKAICSYDRFDSSYYATWSILNILPIVVYLILILFIVFSRSPQIKFVLTGLFLIELFSGLFRGPIVQLFANLIDYTASTAIRFHSSEWPSHGFHLYWAMDPFVYFLLFLLFILSIIFAVNAVFRNKLPEFIDESILIISKLTFSTGLALWLFGALVFSGSNYLADYLFSPVQLARFSSLTLGVFVSTCLTLLIFASGCLDYYRNENSWKTKLIWMYLLFIAGFALQLIGDEGFRINIPVSLLVLIGIHILMLYARLINKSHKSPSL